MPRTRAQRITLSAPAARARRRVAWMAPLGALLVAACEALPTRPPDSRQPDIRGVTVVDWTAAGYGRPVVADILGNVRSAGATHVALIVTAYQASPADHSIRSDPARTPTAGALELAMDAATEAGLAIVLKPHVDLDDGAWRGTIVAEDPDAWFASYRAFLLPWADVAEAHGAALFVVGTELAGMAGLADRWRELIAEVRERYSGRLAYAASWDEAAGIGFWHELDVIGIDFYFPVAGRSDPGRLEILAHWQPWLERLRLLHEQTGRPIVLTEIGYRSVDGAGMHPYAFGTARPEDQEEQADLYWAALQATGGHDWLAGLLWWNWRADGGGGPGDGDYNPTRKLASHELRAAWRP